MARTLRLLRERSGVSLGSDLAERAWPPAGFPALEALRREGARACPARGLDRYLTCAPCDEDLPEAPCAWCGRPLRQGALLPPRTAAALPRNACPTRPRYAWIPS